MAILWASEAHSPRDTPMVSIPTVLSASQSTVGTQVCGKGDRMGQKKAAES